MRHRSPGARLAHVGAKRRGIRGKHIPADTTAVQLSEVSYASTTSVSVSSSFSSTEIPTPGEPGSSKKRPYVARKRAKPSPGHRSVVSKQRESPSTSRATPDGLERSPSTQPTSSKTISRSIALSHEGEEELRDPFGSLSQQIEVDRKSKKSKKVRKRTKQYKTSKDTLKIGSMDSQVVKRRSPLAISLKPSSSVSLDDQSSLSRESTQTVSSTAPSHKRTSEATKTKSKQTKVGSVKSFPREGYQPEATQGSQESSREPLAGVPGEIVKIDIREAFEKLFPEESKRDLRPSKASMESGRLLKIYSEEGFDEHVPLGGADETKRRSTKRELLTVTGERRSSRKLSADVTKLSSKSTSKSFESSDLSGSGSVMEEIADEYDKRQQVVTKDIDRKFTIPTGKLASREMLDEVVEDESPSTTKKSSKAKGRGKKSSAGDSRPPIPRYKEAKSTDEAEESERQSVQRRVERRRKKKVKKRAKSNSMKPTHDEEMEQLEDRSSSTVSDTDASQYAEAEEVDQESQEEEDYDVHVRKEQRVRRLSTSLVDITGEEDEQLVSVVRKHERKTPSTKATASKTTDKERRRTLSVPGKPEKQKYPIASTSYEEEIAIKSDGVIFDKDKRSPTVAVIELTETKKRGRRRIKKVEVKYADEDGGQEEDRTSPSLLLMLSVDEGSLVYLPSKPAASFKSTTKKAKAASHSRHRRSSFGSTSRMSSITDPTLGASKDSEVLDQSSDLLDSTLLPSSLDLTEADSSAAPQLTEDTHSGKFTPVQCEWFLTDSHTLVCHHPVLGDIRSRPCVTAQSFIGWPDRHNYNWRGFYDSEVYTVVDPLPDDSKIRRKPRH